MENFERWKTKIILKKVSKKTNYEYKWWPNLIWDKVTKCIKNVAKEVLGESKEKEPLEKETWWWNEKVQAAIKLKRTNYKIWQETRDEKSLKKYRNAKKEAKKAVSNAKLKAYDNLYNKLDTKEGEKDI